MHDRGHYGNPRHLWPLVGATPMPQECSSASEWKPWQWGILAAGFIAIGVAHRTLNKMDEAFDKNALAWRTERAAYKQRKR